MKRHLVLPTSGKLIINTDLHGNHKDFVVLCDIFRKAIELNPCTHWAILGDMVHAPSARFRELKPELYDYSDGSWDIIAGIMQMQKEFPGKVHYVLGNHDHAHIGGPFTRKFYPNEVEHLESQLQQSQIQTLHQFFYSALLAIVAPCGVVLTHGSPDEVMQKLEDLDSLSLNPEENNEYQNKILKSFLTDYGQEQHTSAAFLQTVSQSTGSKINIVIHGHDRHEDGWFTEGNNQLCPVIFGAPKHKKRYLQLDLGATYNQLQDIRQEQELSYLYPCQN